MEMSTNEFDLRKIETQVLKVHINCEGCKQKVKKLLRRIEGVYTVDIDTEQHKVTVTGTADSETLIKKLGRSAKHAEIWSLDTYQNQNQEQASWIKDGKVQNQMQRLINKGLKASKRRPMLTPTCGTEVEDDWGAYHRYLNQNMGTEATSTGGIDQTIMAKTAMDNAHLDGKGIQLCDGTMPDHVKPLMGFHRDEFSGLQHHCAGLPSFEHHHPSYMMVNNMQGHQYNHPSPAMMMMNIDMHTMDNPMVHQPQIMNYASLYPPTTDYYCNFSSVP